jgi:hypothetical protein
MAVKIQAEFFWIVMLCSVLWYSTGTLRGVDLNLHRRENLKHHLRCSTTTLHGVTTQKTSTLNYLLAG